MCPADVNGDGRPDVVGRTYSQRIGVILAQPDGTLGPWSAIFQGDYLTGFDVADVNQDGAIDVLVSDTATNRIMVLPGHGDGNFGEPIATSLTAAPTQFVTADFDGDHVLDVAFRSYSAATLTIAKGDASGRFVETYRRSVDGNPLLMVAADLDSDGRTDLVLLRNTPFPYAVYYAKTDGTLEEPALTTGPGACPATVKAADVDGDGDFDLVSSEFNAKTVTVVLNQGARTFAAPVPYSIPTSVTTSDPYDFIVGDVTGDAVPDLVVTLASSERLGTFPGLGNGTFGPIAYATVFDGYSSVSPVFITAGDFNGDGRLDVAVSTSPSPTRVVLFANASGDASVTVTTRYPVITAGQTTTFTVSVGTAPGFVPPYLYEPPFPTGDVVVMSGSTTLGTAKLSNRKATLDVSSLPAGEYSITATFNGDDSYRAAVSAPITQKVINEQTSITLVNPTEAVSIPYGQSVHLEATATSGIAGPLEGSADDFASGHRAVFGAVPIAVPPGREK